MTTQTLTCILFALLVAALTAIWQLAERLERSRALAAQAAELARRSVEELEAQQKILHMYRQLYLRDESTVLKMMGFWEAA